MICYALREKRTKKYYDNDYDIWYDYPSDATLYRDIDVINLRSIFVPLGVGDELEIVEIELTVKEGALA